MSSKDFMDFVGLFEDLFLENGFSRKKLVFHKKNEWYCFVVDWQLSRDKLANGDKFTINCGVFSFELASARQEGLAKSRDVWSCHLQDRFGHLLPSNDDKWYVLEPGGEKSLFLELKFDILRYLFDFFEKFSNRDTLYNIWRSGISPGQTDFMRKEYISQIEKLRGR